MRVRFVKCVTKTISALAIVLSFAGPPVCAQVKNDDTKTIKDFETRVSKYVDLRKAEAGSSPRPTASPDKVAGSQADAAVKVQTKRPPTQGDIFTPEVATYFRRQISATLAGPEGAKIRASLRHAEPVRGISLKVNQVYPQGVPLQSTPPSLLLSLPTLPKELEYRIVGRSLVLHDTVPNLVVDYVADALPPDRE